MKRLMYFFFPFAVLGIIVGLIFLSIKHGFELAQYITEDDK